MPAREFVDSNIWLYASVLAGDAGAEQKHYRASDLLSRVDRPVINSQVVREVCSNLLKKAKLGEADVQRVIQDWYLTCELHPSSEQQHLLASRLRETSSFSFWDSLIVAAALDAGCSTLYSEDMQHGQVVDGRLTIVNPLLD